MNRCTTRPTTGASCLASMSRPRSCSPKTKVCPQLNGWRPRSLARSSCGCRRALTIRLSSAIRLRTSKPSAHFSRSSAMRRPNSIGYLPPSCSPTSWPRSQPRRLWATGPGETCWKRHHTLVRGALGRFRGAEVDTAGDGFLATFDGPARAVRCAQHIIEAVHPLGMEIRAGVHTGEFQMIDGKVGGLAVVIGARLGSLAKANQVLVSQTVKDLTAGSGLTFEDAGEHELKGVPDRWHLYGVVG